MPSAVRGPSASTYSSDGPSETARLAGSVHGVVVQIGIATCGVVIDRDAEHRRHRQRTARDVGDIDRRRLFVGVFDLRLGQRRAAVETPVHGFGAAQQMPAFDDLRQRAQHVGLEAEIHRPVRVFPVAEHAQALEIAALDVDLLAGVLAALLPERSGVELVADLAVLLLDRDLDRQAMAIPARHVRRVEAGQQLRLHHDVLEHLVDGVADVDRAVGVRRAVVQHEAALALAGLVANLRVQALALPARERLGLALGQVAAHREIRRRQIQRGLVLVWCVVVHAKARRWSCMRMARACSASRCIWAVSVARSENFNFVAQLRDELDFDATPVDVVIEVEQMRFEQWLDAVDRRPRAQAGYRRPGPALIGTAAYAMHPAGVDPGQRRRLARKAHVRGRKAQRAAQLLAAHDPSADRIRPTQQPRRRGEIAGLQRCADARAGHAFAVELHRRDLAGNEAARRRPCVAAMRCHRCAPCRNETPGRPISRAPAGIHQHALDEILGAQRAQARIEAQQADVVGTEPEQPFHFRARQQQSRRRVGRREEFARQRLETQRHRRHVERASTRHSVAHQRLMPKMQAVEGADADHTAVRVSGPALDVTKQPAHWPEV